MVFSAKSKNGGGSGDSWGTGFLLIFFPEDDNFNRKKTLLSLSSSSTASSSCPASPSSPFNNAKPAGTPTKSTRSSTSAVPLIYKTRSTLSICGLLVFTTLLLFTLSTFEPATPLRHSTQSSRRLLLTDNHPNSWKQQNIPTMQRSPPISLSKITNFFHPSSNFIADSHNKRKKKTALQGMGILYRRGTKAMSDLIVGHVKEDVTKSEFRSFIRMLHHNGLLSRSDLVFIYPSSSSATKLSSVVEEDNESFLKLVYLSRELKNSTSRDPILSRYLKTTTTSTAANKEQGTNTANSNGSGTDGKEKKEEKEPVWGKGSNYPRTTTNSSTEQLYLSVADDLTQMNYGSIVGFDASELDPENSLSGFLDHVSLKLRRWACYPMLLGRVRRNYKHMMLVDVKDILVFQDPLTKIRNKSQESVFLWSSSSSKQQQQQYGRQSKSSGKGHHHHHSGGSDQKGQPALSSGIIVGGSRGVRRLANAVLNEIVRATIEHKGKGRNSVSESGVIDQLIRNGFLLKNINLIEPSESIGDATKFIMTMKKKSLAGLSSSSSSSSSNSNMNNNYSQLMMNHASVVHERGHSSSSSSSSSSVSNFDDVDSVIRTVICSSSELYSSVYRDCLAADQ